MEETAEKVPFQAYSSLKPRGFVRVKTTAVVAFIAGAVLLLFGGIGAFCLWKVSEKEVISTHYSNIDIKIEDDSDAADGKIVEVQDFKAGITAVKFPGKEKCYIKSQVRSELSEEADAAAVKSDVGSLVWIASEEPLKDVSFLSPEILRFCGDLPIYWHHPANSRALRKRRSVTRVRRQSTGGLNGQQARRRNSTSSAREEERPTGPDYNPENPYHRNQEGSEGHMVFDPMLDHRGICCTECHRSYTHCERVCEPHGGYWPWPYNYHGCRPVCRVIMPCRWWAARVLGLV
ncbi:leukocyte cell-derived chemotaxin 1-like isoform X2 [Sinocyclocheilus anshuiensis]|uniref:leukocyte cell-derived chemotaxin 1-like isoform X1 n=1 Tax=Sinocyclocheilus anshuiensis TaxID=1608454 RepID=UPI0007B7DC97|nr:PREDICTED: leukocyte cell-derived chemotaxin 1-like isoform X1 [Sinocyclocheilus anshuiensis]XP_016345274.1 PREDICTED: leukocyte cell-derived chemotaxin 1-like isoform X2 [Sinocyclocheilus anshuiensis]